MLYIYCTRHAYQVHFVAFVAKRYATFVALSVQFSLSLIHI